MKIKKASIFFVLILLTFTQCNKSYWHQKYRGDISATLNGKNWEPVLIARMTEQDELYFLIDVYENERWTENLGLSHIPPEEGIYNLHKSSYNSTNPSASYSLSDQDVVLSYFSVDTTYQSNNIQIDKINTFWNKVESSFEVRLIMNGTANAPRTDNNTVHIICDEFSTSIH